MATLAASNKYLADADKRARAVRLTVGTSSAIEGIHAPFAAAAAQRVETTAQPKPSEALKPSRRVKSA